MGEDYPIPTAYSGAHIGAPLLKTRYFLSHLHNRGVDVFETEEVMIMEKPIREYAGCFPTERRPVLSHYIEIGL